MMQIFEMIYYLLQTLSKTIIAFVATVWMIEEALINLMKTMFLYALGWVCHPLIVIPMLLGTYIVIKSTSMRPSVLVGSNDKQGMRNKMRTPRIHSYRSNGSISSRSNDSCDFDIRDYRKSN